MAFRVRKVFGTFEKRVPVVKGVLQPNLDYLNLWGLRYNFSLDGQKGFHLSRYENNFFCAYYQATTQSEFSEIYFIANRILPRTLS